MRAIPLDGHVRLHAERCASCRSLLELLGDRLEPDCTRAELWLSLHEDGTLDDVGRNALERHLASCTRCRAIADEEVLEREHFETLPSVDPADFTIGRELDRGGMGRIMAAQDRRIGRTVVVKELLDMSPQAAARFEREARVTARLQHPGIVPIYEIGRWPDGVPFYTMRLVEGRTLREAISRAATPAARIELLPSLIAACEAVAFAHSKRIIHRDLTPRNILVGDYGETVVIDWGLAKDLAAAEPVDALASEPEVDPKGQLTSAGAVVGTYAYMPPEQANAGAVDERSDVYALGAILYHLLSGGPPFRGLSGDQLRRAVRIEAPQPIREAARHSAPDLISIVGKAMSRDPADRYPTALELADELQRFQTGRLVEAHTYTRAQKLTRFVARNRAAVVITLLATIVVVAGLLVSLRGILASRAEARATARELLLEEGRVEQLAGHNLRALAYLDELRRLGESSAALDLLLGNALADLAIGTPLDCEGDDRLLDVSRDGSLLAVGCHDTGRVWRVRDRAGAIAPQLVMTLQAQHSIGFDAVGFSHDGSRVATWGEDGIARLWEIAHPGRFVELRPPAGQLAEVMRLSFSPDDRIVMTTDKVGVARIWDAASGVQTKAIDVFPRAEAIATGIPIQTLYGRLIGGEGSPLRLYTLTFQGIGKKYDVETGALLGQLEHGSTVGSADNAPDGKLAATCGIDSVVKVIDLETGVLRFEAKGHTDVIYKCLFSADGKRLVTASHDGTAKLWDVDAPIDPAHPDATRAARLVATFDHGDVVLLARLSPDGRRLVTATPGKFMKVWDAESAALLATYDARGKDAMFLPDGRLAALRGDGKVQLWSSERVRIGGLGPDNNHTVRTTSLDGSVVALEDARGVVSLFDTRGRPTGQRLHSPLARGRDRIAGIELVQVEADQPIRWAVVIAGAPLLAEHRAARIAVSGPTPSSLELSEDGTTVALAWADHVELWEVATGKQTASFPGVDRVLLDEHGRHAVIWREAIEPGRGRSLTMQLPRVWDGARELPIPAINGRPIGFAGDRLVMSELFDGNRAMSLWTLDGRRLRLEPKIEIAPTIDPTKRWVTTISTDREVAVWAASDGSLRSAFTNERYQTAQSNGDGTLVVAIGDYGRAVMVLEPSDGRVLARYRLDHDPATVRSEQFEVPSSAAWWTPDSRAIVSQARSIAIWRATNPYSERETRDLVRKRVPWRVDNGRLVEIRNGRIAGRVTRHGEPVAGVQIVVRARRPADLNETTNWITMMPQENEAYTVSDREGRFVVEDLVPGQYEYQVTVDTVSHEEYATVDDDGEPYEYQLP